jgi:glycosyltransferase 2 family protein
MGHEGTAAPPHRKFGLGKIALIIGKIAVTGACFWYLSRQVDFAKLAQAATGIDYGWAALAVLAIAVQVALVGTRWSEITNALARRAEPVSRRAMIAIAAIGIFFGQVLPYAAGDAMRIWMLARLGINWRIGIVSVLIDRGVGVLALFAIASVVMLLPSSLAVLGMQRSAIAATFGGIVAIAIVALLLTPRLAPIVNRFQVTRWIGTLAISGHDVLIKSGSGTIIIILALMIHTLTIAAVWCTGQALGMSFSLVDAAFLFVVMLGVVLIPISFGGWGVREIAVVSLLSANGVPEERALLFSASFGLVMLAGALPGAAVWASYSPAGPMPDRTGAEHAG